MSEHTERVDAWLIVGGVSHDLDFVRLELLKLLAAHPHLRVQVTHDYEAVGLLDEAAFVMSYTCNVKPSEAAEQALADYVSNGGRWFALHASNSILDWTEEGVAAVKDAQTFMRTLGSQFVAHPAMDPYRVEPTQPDHPLVKGIASFETADELYVSDFYGEVEVLMHTRFGGTCPGFIRDQWPEEEDRPVLYINRQGAGSVLYCTLGHARGHWDAPHRTPYYPQIERGAWEHDEFYEVLRRGIAWALNDPAYA